MEIKAYEQQLAQHQENFLALLDSAGLPSQNIFVPTRERFTVFANAGALLERLDDESKRNAVYVSKFFAAVSAGLFDAALNYIWDETILHLRLRIDAYDLEYFYDIAASEEKRKELKTIDDISKLTDEELLRGALKIDLISESGHRNIDLVRYMRNNASAAHPNHLEITGIKLVAMAEDCLREVISTPLPPAAIEVKRLLQNVREDTLSQDDAQHVAAHFPDMGPQRAQKLAKGLYGIFIKRDSSEAARQNIRHLAPLLWPYIDEDTRKDFGLKHAYYSANNHVAEKNYAYEFLRVVDGLGYITDQHRAIDVLAILDELSNAHSGFNNFYNEVLPAKRLASIIGNPPNIPKGAEKKYIYTLINTFLTNGNGVANSADVIYIELISGLKPKQAIYALGLVFDDVISSKLRVRLCELKYRELIEILAPKISTHAAKQLLSEMTSEGRKLSDLKSDNQLFDLFEKALAEIA